jgi:hypothetical protein
MYRKNDEFPTVYAPADEATLTWIKSLASSLR